MNRANLFFEVTVERCRSGGDALRIGWASTATLLLLGEEDAAPRLGGGSSGGGCASACGSAGASWAIGMDDAGRLRRFGPTLGAEGVLYGCGAAAEAGARAGAPSGARSADSERRGWQRGDVVGCLWDRDSREVRFLLNGVDQGVAFSDALPDTTRREVDATNRIIARARSGARCRNGHALRTEARARNFCDVCGERGTAMRCSSGCDYDLCARCFASTRASLPARSMREEAAAAAAARADLAASPSDPATEVSCILCTVTFHANHAHNLTRSP
jgi:hypothetical protein